MANINALDTIGSEYEGESEKVIRVHNGEDAVWVTNRGNGEVLFLFEDSNEGTVRSVAMSAEQWKHLASLVVS